MTTDRTRQITEFVTRMMVAAIPSILHGVAQSAPTDVGMQYFKDKGIKLSPDVVATPELAIVHLKTSDGKMFMKDLLENVITRGQYTTSDVEALQAQADQICGSVIARLELILNEVELATAPTIH